MIVNNSSKHKFKNSYIFCVVKRPKKKQLTFLANRWLWKVKFLFNFQKLSGANTHRKVNFTFFFSFPFSSLIFFSYAFHYIHKQTQPRRFYIGVLCTLNFNLATDLKIKFVLLFVSFKHSKLRTEIFLVEAILTIVELV